MNLSPGVRLGPYEIVAPIGAGGMGEVWRARDTRLDRSVAIKVLSAGFAADEGRQARFEREAKAISQLGHPRICALYDVGNAEGHAYLVMEYLEGETLAARIDRGPMPLDQVIRFGAEICDALDRAHSAGIIHRDLKPANVMITRSGTKLLDFGLAKQSAPAFDSDAVTVKQATLTGDGAILGTLMYMAPEQLRGETLDARADIFALGALLYEMASGRHAFRGTSKATTIAAILHDEPAPMESFVSDVPPAFAAVVRRCLAKDPDQRWNCVRDLSYELQHLSRPSVADIPAALPMRRWAPWVLAAAASLIALAAIVFATRRPAGVDTLPIRFSFRPPANAILAFNEVAMPLALSPDGKLLAYTAWVEGRTAILLRSLDSTDSQLIPAAAGGAWPFWSPDGKWIGFFAEGVMKRVPAAGGPAEVISGNVRGGGASWSRSGEILFHEWGPGTSDEIQHLHADGSGRGEATHAPKKWSIWPSFLPDDKHFLFSLASNIGTENGIYAGELGQLSHVSAIVRSASLARYANGSLFYVDDGTLLRQPFDPKTLRTSGDAVRIAEDVHSFRLTSAAAFSVSNDGKTIAYEHAPAAARLLWLDRTGNVRGQLGPAADFRSFRITRDGQRVAATIVDPASGVSNASVLDIRRNVAVPLTHLQPGAQGALASPDGKSFVFTTSLGISAAPNLQLALFARPENPLALFPVGGPQLPTDWSPDGHWLLVTVDNGADDDIFVASVTPGSKPDAFAKSRFNEREGVFSPDGKWVAYVSDESGKAEVYCAPFGTEGERVKISTSGGSEPRWSRDGKELLYVGGDRRLVSVPITLGKTLGIGVPVPLFRIDCAASRHFEIFAQQCYDIAPDGNFLVLTRDDDDPSGTIVVIRQ
jgi:roadblock/LC7 domain-containing protein